MKVISNKAARGHLGLQILQVWFVLLLKVHLPLQTIKFMGMHILAISSSNQIRFSRTKWELLPDKMTIRWYVNHMADFTTQVLCKLNQHENIYSIS